MRTDDDRRVLAAWKRIANDGGYLPAPTGTKSATVHIERRALRDLLNLIDRNLDEWGQA